MAQTTVTPSEVRSQSQGPCVILKSCAVRVVHAASARIVDRIFFMFVRLFGSFPFGGSRFGTAPQQS